MTVDSFNIAVKLNEKVLPTFPFQQRLLFAIFAVLSTFIVIININMKISTLIILSENSRRLRIDHKSYLYASTSYNLTNVDDDAIITMITLSDINNSQNMISNDTLSALAQSIDDDAILSMMSALQTNISGV